ncbi:hypothetical protein TELCIR_00169 [Teladorsagia circumcincta]|uniref:Uncharacterized protein n=1 Tax=Teladorsagia circumcincta TaxID=45464 RepID=A0A2G9V5B9_TELCI|nr:hypothetical protein TELCIR_00169 [Teladorsagia circumcincta]
MDSVENSIQDPPSVAAPPAPEPESDSVVTETPESWHSVRSYNTSCTIYPEIHSQSYQCGRNASPELRDLCAMRSVEIHDLMASEYPAIYQEFQKVTAERLKALMAEQAKEMEAIKNDSKKMAELREKAIKSAAEFNRELQLAKKLERQHYWDVQTSSATNKWKKVPAKYTKPDPYPVALIHGQFQNYYRKFTSSELRRLPLGSVLDGEHLFPVHRDPSPPPINVTERDMQRFEKMAAATQQSNAPSPSPAVKTEVMTTPRAEIARKSARSTAKRAVAYAEDDEDES